MKRSFLRVLAAAVGAAALSTLAFAGDPTGSWHWDMKGRNGNTMQATLDLALKDGALTGTSHSSRGGDTAISNATFKDDTVSFSVVREYNGNKFESKYSGKLAGDTIKGEITMPGRDGNTRTIEWNASRGAPAAATPPPAAAAKS